LTLETREVHVSSQVRRWTVPHTRACSIEATIAEVVVRPWNEACPGGVNEGLTSAKNTKLNTWHIYSRLRHLARKLIVPIYRPIL